MKTFHELLLSNKAWAREMRERKPRFFADQTEGQRPPILWVGCSDSRVSPDQITQTMPGELFIHRNIANIVRPDDSNFGAVLQFSLDVLKVRHIVICGHYGCGGIAAALEGKTTGHIHSWLSDVRQVVADHADELDALPDEERRASRLVELNVRKQVFDLASEDVVRAALDGPNELTIHGMVYDLRDGLIKEIMSIDSSESQGESHVLPTVLAN